MSRVSLEKIIISNILEKFSAHAGKIKDFCPYGNEKIHVKALAAFPVDFSITCKMNSSLFLMSCFFITIVIMNVDSHHNLQLVG